MAKTQNRRKRPPIHQWTHDGDKVLLVKCLNRDGTTHGGFVWPREGAVAPINWSREPTCDTGGLFGWPWGVHIGDGRTPDACAEWLVFAAKPENVIFINDGGTKAKAVPGENGELPEVVYRGTMAEVMAYTRHGRIAWIESKSTGKATGNRGSASATGYSGSASATGDYGSASATGDSGSASATGYYGSASATGNRGSASATGNDSSIELGPMCLGCATGRRVTWTVRLGAKLTVGWLDGNNVWQARLFDSAQMDVNDGDRVLIDLGEIKAINDRLCSSTLKPKRAKAVK